MPTRFDVVTPNSPQRLGDQLQLELHSGRWTNLEAAVAYVKMSGVRHVGRALFTFASTGRVRMTVGIDQQGSSLEGVQTLWQLLGAGAGSLYVLNNRASNPSPTFHPKVWLFFNRSHALLITGSGNLTAGGLFTNYEFGSLTELDLRMAQDRSVFDKVRVLLEEWSDERRAEVSAVSALNIQRMHDSGELPSETAISKAAALARASRAVVAGVSRGALVSSGLFGRRTVVDAPAAEPLPALPPPPVAAKKPVRIPGSSSSGGSQAPVRVPPVSPLHDTLFIVVNPRRKTEIFLAKKPLKQDPAFFGWPFLGLTTPTRPGNPGQPQPDPLPTATVTVFAASGAVAGSTVDKSLKLWTYSIGKSANDDFRMTLVDGLHRLVTDGSVLVMKRQPPSGYDYEIEVYPPGHKDHATMLGMCTQSLPGGRRFGWQ